VYDEYLATLALFADRVALAGKAHPPTFYAVGSLLETELARLVCGGARRITILR
jgi:hypothetical protein